MKSVATFKVPRIFFMQGLSARMIEQLFLYVAVTPFANYKEGHKHG